LKFLIQCQIALRGELLRPRKRLDDGIKQEINMKRQVLLMMLFLALLSSSCGLLPSSQTDNLNGTSWEMISYGGSALLPGTSMTVLFREGELNGSASCNHYFGSYKIQEEDIQVEGLGWTEMACLDPEGIMEQEQTLMGLLSQATFYSIQENLLLITTKTGEIIKFQKLTMSD
jgi:heat shock protein HslJ